MIRTNRFLARSAVVGLAMLLAVALAPEAQAAKAKSTQTEANWIKFDETANTVQVKVRNPGKGPNKKMMKKGKEVTFNVIPEGSVLTRTSVAINGKKGHVKDIPAGKQVFVYWVPDPKKKGEFFARKIDVVLSEEELDERFGAAE
ncbi:MAG: hypothetical protein HKP30_18870 [Myxococcales bacterium]|nr:hypothetical protein [Myxococcales bacterium]